MDNINDRYFDEYIENTEKISFRDYCEYALVKNDIEVDEYKKAIINTLDYQRFALKRSIEDFGIEVMKEIEKLLGKILYKFTKKL